MKTQRGKIGDYMKYLRERHGYTSLKMEFMQMQFPALGGHKENEGLDIWWRWRTLPQRYQAWRKKRKYLMLML